MIRVLCSMLIACSLTGTAQYWKAVGRGPIGPGGTATLFADTVMDALLCGGTFAWMMNEEDTITGAGMAKWNGLRWDSIGHPMEPLTGNISSTVGWFLRFHDQLHVGGGQILFIPPDIGSASLGRFNDSTLRWEPVGCINPVWSGISNLVPKSPQGPLYATGFKGALCGNPESCVFIYTQDSFVPWEPFDQIPAYPNNYVGFIFDYRGKTYMTGQYRDPNSTWFCSFMRYNGQSWEYVPGWGNHLGNIRDINIHNDTLYVTGSFREAAGAPGNAIARFDGEQWDNMGGGFVLAPSPSSVAGFSLQWFHDELYVGGQFTHAAGVPVNCLAKWNGRQWCAIPGERTNSIGATSKVTSMAVWRDSLYIVGSFNAIDGQPINQIAQWIGGDATGDCSSPVGIAERPADDQLSVFPNPASTTITLQGLPTGSVRFRVYDATGRIVQSISVGVPQLRIEGLSPGTYVIKALDALGMPLGQARFVKY